MKNLKELSKHLVDEFSNIYEAGEAIQFLEDNGREHLAAKFNSDHPDGFAYKSGELSLSVLDFDGLFDVCEYLSDGEYDHNSMQENQCLFDFDPKEIEKKLKNMGLDFKTEYEYAGEVNLGGLAGEVAITLNELTLNTK